ncbi:hypothetical protein BCV72DRAFT_306885 [Rhizopus microsporus var. microsporus]|uniref:Cyclin N-terminal domain-containing protein n=2 Tax=Rhizopus microsporus TaxID=58291 RepID=A0A2G4T588_RHIZD|nr:uncharacterized protein RHIMIDRAFT_233779 [Rhizopus microsporus ATCC 52813]ORE04913.1 hypothetical protein BCV72DRAFT_306885 [Rhizopus microsporus var. microsporus]PHZ16177.1 hypothetical protein RHIMIDRAFT_233779 [Rhizopus microsporus ATCC 52813]
MSISNQGNPNKIKRDSVLAYITVTVDTLLPCSNCKDQQRILPPLNEFVNNFIEKSKLPIPILLITLLYLTRLKTKLPSTAKGAYDTPYRLFLASVLTSSKYLSDLNSLTSIRVCEMIQRQYSVREINSMERSFLSLLSYDLRVTADQLQELNKSL